MSGSSVRGGGLSFDKRFLAAGHGLAVAGVLGVAATGGVSPTFPAVALLGLGWSFIHAWTGKGFELAPPIANAITLATTGVVLFSIFIAGAPPVSAIAEFLLLLTAIKGFAAKQNRDWLQIFALSFFQLLAASALTIEPAFALAFILYLVLAPWVMVLFHVRYEMTNAGLGERLAREAFIDATLFRSVAGMSGVLFLLTVGIFLIFPRVGTGFFGPSLDTEGGLTGFSDDVGLGDVTALHANDAVAMRVTVDDPRPIRAAALYWRGSVLTHYDGSRWHRGRVGYEALRRVRPGTYATEIAPRRAKIERLDILLEPIQSASLILIGRPLEIRGPFTTIIHDSLGNFRAVSPIGNARKRYELLTALVPDQRPPTSRTLELPENLDPRIPELAGKLTAAATSPAGIVESLLSHFDRGFGYSLEPGDPGDADPLAYFLFDTRAGHCEYFASALAIMLRSAGVPTRLVSGYLGGEWNTYGGYFQIRQTNAHTWVEAWVDGAWRRLDPTPAREIRGGGAFAALSAFADSTQMQWYRWVVNYSAHDQIRAAISLRERSRKMREALSLDAWRKWWADEDATTEDSPGSTLFPLLGIPVLLALAYWLRRRGGGGAAAKEERALTKEYRRLLRVFETAGISKRPSETPDEFVARVGAAHPDAIRWLGPATADYQRARFDPARPDESGAVDRLRRARKGLVETLRAAP